MAALLGRGMTAVAAGVAGWWLGKGKRREGGMGSEVQRARLPPFGSSKLLAQLTVAT